MPTPNLYLPPAVPGRIVFTDTEFTTLVDGERELWEGAIIIRDPGEEDLEFVWQVRPSLAYASPDSLRIGGYYRRNYLAAHPVGTGLIIAQTGHFPELKPGDQLDPDRVVPAAAIAAPIAAALDGVHLVAAVPDADDLAIGRWLASHDQMLTNHYRHRDIEAMMHAYLLGRRRGLELARADTVTTSDAPAYALTLPDTALAPGMFSPPFDPKPMYAALGVPLLGPGEAHNAMHDCRQVRSAWDVMNDPRSATID